MSKTKTNSAKRDIVNFIGIVAIIILVNYVLSFFFGRFDLTEDKRHSLSDNTRKLLQDKEILNDRIYIRIYLDGELPADIKKIRNAIQERLDEFIVYAGDKVQYEFINPNGDANPDINLEIQKNIYSEGIRPTDIQIMKSGKTELNTIWPGAIIEYKGRTVDQIQFFNKRIVYANEDTRGLADRTINNLEYKLISAIRRVTADNKSTVGFLQGHGELDEWQTADVRDGLKRFYHLEDVEINGQIAALNEVDALVIAQPKERFNERDKFVIDQFVMKGGKVLWFVDPIDVNRDSLYYTGKTLGLVRDLNIEKDMIYKYGARLNTDLLIDQTCAPLYIPGHPQNVVEWYFYPNLQRVEHPITKNIDPIKSEYTSSVDIVNATDKAVKKTVLLETSTGSLNLRAPVRVNYSIVDIEPNFKAGTKGIPVAVMLEGSFTSAFENRLPEAFLNSDDYKTRFKSDTTKMLVVADGDIIRNEVETKMAEGRPLYKAIPLSFDIFQVSNPNNTPKYVYGNKDFVLNAIDYMLDDYSLIDVRTKTITLRSLDMTKVNDEKEFWKLINIGVPLLCILALALFQLFIRKRNYTK
jgi:ABC-2 type transport system permease protein